MCCYYKTGENISQSRCLSLFIRISFYIYCCCYFSSEPIQRELIIYELFNLVIYFTFELTYNSTCTSDVCLCRCVIKVIDRLQTYRLIHFIISTLVKIDMIDQLNVIFKSLMKMLIIDISTKQLCCDVRLHRQLQIYMYELMYILCSREYYLLD